MNRWKLVVPVVTCMAPMFVAGCTTREVVVREPAPRGEVVVESAPAQPPAEVVVQSAPPPVQVEVVPAAPSAEHIWIAGHWHWNGGAWVWNRGHYEVRRVGYHWVPAHYAVRGGGVVYVAGYWGR